MRGKITRTSQVKAIRDIQTAASSRLRQESDPARDATISRPGIRNGVKTERDTQPVQVRMLKAQTAVLKQIAALEGRTTSDIVRFLVDGYIDYCLTHWPIGDELDILERALRLNDYESPQLDEADAKVFGLTTDRPEGYDTTTDSGAAVEPYERYTEDDAK